MTFLLILLPILSCGGNGMKKSMLFFTILLFLIIIVAITILTNNIQSFADMSKYEEVSFKNAMVTGDIVNVRLGPGLSYPVVCKVNQDEVLRVYAKINGWYIIQNKDNYVGMVCGDYVKPYTASSSQPKVNTKNTLSSKLTPEEQELLKLINEARKKVGVRLLKVDSKLIKTSRSKAEEMIKKNYFAHTSPTYGSPFSMMKQYGVIYRAAGENLAGNVSVKGAFESLMKSEGHRKNILNKNFNYVGIGVVESKTYGKILVQHFVGRSIQ